MKRRSGTVRIGVGSGNPVKRRAVELAIGEELGAGGDTGITVESVAVDSGVSEQPTGHEETITGARNRAAAVHDAGDTDADRFDFAVGIEGGVARFPGVEGRFLVMWAAVDDGERVEVGSGPALRLPDDVAARINAGEELGPVMDERLGTDGIAERGGAAAALTDGRLTRAGALSSAVAGALGPFVSTEYTPSPP
ncbi:inosine/xanthosine triphosphatase [Halorubrum vacuolatum]|uniref:inosine/xanthosine triphosphatase n=1 Tax=Halorubrum vacuolatum TaxID=63740 RepID=A0A238W153_HALVU|nr:inosine/xanthosine triphosphatase [Halorubrum vacuolatum]SNR40335.1 inosine/xanthosine triphosphatase [Halorubrum vacuolatum]